MSKVLIEKQVLQTVVDYLSTKPFSEVFQLIGMLQQSVQDFVEPESEEEKTVEENNPDTKDI